MKYIPQSDWTTGNLTYWKDGTRWCCAVPRDDVATQSGFSWKKFGLIGRGKTRKEATDDWEKWKRASDFVSDIY